MIYDKKKDSDTRNTIKNIQSILNNVGIENLEESYVERIINDHVTEAVFLKWNNDMTVTSNGKGTNIDYARASAYGEFMERLENGSLFNTNAPDILNMTPLELEKSNILDFWFNANTDEILKYKKVAVDICCNYANYYNSEDKKTAELLPFYHLNKDEISYISPHLLQYVGGFTGSCAGNTPYEALVEGLSEVFERHVVRTSILDSISFPDIPEKIYLKYESIKKIIDYCKKLGFKVIVKDASLGKKYPVACAVLIDEKTNGYYVWFGAHPSLPIAIERCFTEIFQGIDFSNKKLVKALFKFDGKGNNSIPFAKCDNAFNHRFLEVNSEFFTKTPEYKFNYSDWENNETLSNEQLLKNMIKILTDSNIDIFIRDVSFLDFPAYLICVPQLISTLINLESNLGLDIRNNYYKCVRVIGEDKPINLTSEEILDFYKYAFHLNMSMRDDYKNFEILYLITLLKIKNYKVALIVLKQLSLSRKYSKYSKMFFFLEDYIKLKMNNELNENSIIKLTLKYGKYFSQKIISIFDKEDSFINAVNQLKKWKLYSLKHINKEALLKKTEISKNIQEYYNRNIPNQMKIKELFK